ncbi:MAG: hypothetical protein IPN17_32175 [Deltaproteobacteria bacterium]|nr:hypothetical protein [Deltaproteobacteria bacterium]MBK8696798.1 hypothetical protein [Deltaproteobacteria bacterium]MBP6833368.1 hypothetical protein [Deltaproteobacteria bacterium]
MGPPLRSALAGVVVTALALLPTEALAQRVLSMATLGPRAAPAERYQRYDGRLVRAGAA